MQTIYKKDSKGKMRFITAYVEGEEVVQISGIVGTDNPVEHRSTAKPKNVGKSNETTAAQQAALEVDYLLKKKLQKDYYLSEELAENTNKLLPQLATDKDKVKIKYPIYGQPKLDGMRLLSFLNDGKYSNTTRTGIPHTTSPHIYKAFDSLTAEDMAIDGELYSHGEDFGDVMRLCKNDDDASEEELKLWIYDIVLLGEIGEAMPFERRLKFLETFSNSLEGKNLPFEFVETVKLSNEDEVKEYHDKCVDAGYEGIILRDPSAVYTFSARNKGLIKYKKWLDEAFTVIDVIPSEKRPSQGKLLCLLENGVIFPCSIKRSHKEREEILKNKHKYIGQKAEVRFLEYTKDGIPRHARCVGFRLDK